LSVFCVLALLRGIDTPWLKVPAKGSAIVGPGATPVNPVAPVQQPAAHIVWSGSEKTGLPSSDPTFGALISVRLELNKPVVQRAKIVYKVNGEDGKELEFGINGTEAFHSASVYLQSDVSVPVQVRVRLEGQPWSEWSAPLTVNRKRNVTGLVIIRGSVE
jgi:hypothetical protein